MSYPPEILDSGRRGRDYGIGQWRNIKPPRDRLQIQTSDRDREVEMSAQFDLK